MCFDATGPKNIVDHKINGYKARAFDSKNLADGIKWVSNNNEHYCKKNETEIC